MNGAPLTRDHGFPVRLIVPGWYGCSCIKWVDRIDLVPDDAPATTQMQEFAARTHQDIATAAGRRTPPLARDFIPAVIDTAAMPVRVEKWIVDGRLAYRITGIIWGGSKPTNALSIRFKASAAVGAGRRLPAAGVDADLEPVVAHLAPRRAGPLPDRPARWTTRRSARGGSTCSSTSARSRSTRSRKNREDAEVAEQDSEVCVLSVLESS